jgi:hypothetical protein
MMTVAFFIIGSAIGIVVQDLRVRHYKYRLAKAQQEIESHHRELRNYRALIAPTEVGPTIPGGVGLTSPVPVSSGSTPAGPEDLATSLEEHFSSVPRTDPRGAGTSWNSALAGPGDLGTAGPKQVGGIRPWWSPDFPAAPDRSEL